MPTKHVVVNYNFTKHIPSKKRAARGEGLPKSGFQKNKGMICDGDQLSITRPWLSPMT